MSGRGMVVKMQVMVARSRKREETSAWLHIEYTSMSVQVNPWASA